MNESGGGIKYILLYIPFFLASVVSTTPTISYFIAWGGSFWIFLLSLTGKIKPLPNDLPFFGQFMRPLFVTQIIFASYMAVTSIFYFVDSIGFYFFTFDPFKVKPEYEVELIVKCQRYYVLAHAAYVHGMLALMNYKPPKWEVKNESISVLMLKLVVVFAIIGPVTRFLPGLNQFAIKFAGLGFTASVIALAFSIPERKTVPILISSALFAFNMAHAIVSGWKEEIIVPLIMLGVYLFPLYKKVVIAVFPALFMAFFTIVPTYNGIVRELSWGGSMTPSDASKEAITRMMEGDVDIAKHNWTFLTGRLSEISMLGKYVEGIPTLREFYGFQIAGQAAMSCIPRVIYRGKPITENLVTERVVAAGVIEEYSLGKVSAKPAMIADAYMSGGAFAIWLFMICLGGIASWVSVKAESLFGGYVIGSGLVYTGLFQVLWRGNCFEFLSNSIFWSAVLMFLLFTAGKKLKWITAIEKNELQPA